MEGILDGMRVVSIPHPLIVPYASRLIGDLGADVVSVEPPEGFGERDNLPPYMRGVPYRDIMVFANQRRVTLNLKKEKGKKVFERLVGKADIFIDHSEPGEACLSWEDLRKINPKLIYCTVTGFGYSGPYKDVKPLDFFIQALSGLMDSNGIGELPLKTGASWPDFAGGAHAAIAILSSVLWRGRTNRGLWIDFSLCDAVLETLTEYTPWVLAEKTGRDTTSPKMLKWNRIENWHPIALPYDGFVSRDGDWVFLAPCLDDQWARCTEMIGKPELKKYKIILDRLVHRAEVQEPLREWAKERTFEEIRAEFAKYDLPVAPMREVEEMLSDPFTKEREMLVDAEHVVAGEIPVVGSPVKVGDDVAKPGKNLARVRFPGQPRGYHNEEVFHEWLNLSSEEIAKLREEQII